MDRKRSYEPLKPSEMPTGPWREVSGDYFGPMPDGQYWFVNSCDFSKWVSVERVSSVSFETIEPVLIKLFNTMGRPLQYKTDNGAPFHSHGFEHFAKKLGFRHRRITPYWPRANAIAETVMRTLSKVLKIVKIEGKKPEIAFGEFLAAYHDTPHTSTGIAPNFLMFCRTGTSGLPAAEESNISISKKPTTLLENIIYFITRE